MKTCPECAESVQEAARKCRFCGYRLDGSTAPASAALVEITNAVRQAPQTSSFVRVLFLLLVIVLLVLMAASDAGVAVIRLVATWGAMATVVAPVLAAVVFGPRFIKRRFASRG
jgi:uncharacterized membrane protein